MKKSKKILNIIGEIDLEEEYTNIFSKNHFFLITNVISETSFFEMTGESMYYALNGYEKEFGVNQKHKKQQIVDAIIARKGFCGGVFYHNSFKGGKDTQLRSTSAVIRTLLAAENDGFYFEKDLNEVIEHHYSYYFNWGEGIWFCHDTSEKDGKTPISHLKTKVWGKEKRNTVTLNTHLDSLTTLLLLLKEKPSYQEGYISIARKGLVSVNNVLKSRNNKGAFNSLLQKIDNYLFMKYLKNLDYETLFWRLYQKMAHPVLFKLLSPTLFFKNGYIGRDLSVANIHVDYLLVNITDFLRLLVVYESLSLELKQKMTVKINKKDLLEIVEKAMKFIHTNNDFKSYLEKNDLQKAWYAEALYLFSFFSLEYKKELKNVSDSNVFNLETTVFAELLK